MITHAKTGPYSPFMPAPAPRQSQESPLAYGARVLRFVMQSHVTATIPDAGIEQALRAAVLATAGAHYADRPADAAHTADAAAQAKRLLLAAQDTRRRLDAADAAQAQPQPQPPSPHGTGPGGARVPRPTAPTRPTPPAAGAQAPSDPRAALAQRF